MKAKPDIPLFIIKKSRNYYYNTLTGKFIRAEHLPQYLQDQQAKPTKTVKEYWWTDK